MHDAIVFSFEADVRRFLRYARKRFGSSNVWAIAIEIRVVDGRPAFVVGADSGGG